MWSRSPVTCWLWAVCSRSWPSIAAGCATTAEFQAIYRRHRGVAKNHAWPQHRVAGLNLRRLIALGLNLNNGAWQLA